MNPTAFPQYPIGFLITLIVCTILVKISLKREQDKTGYTVGNDTRAAVSIFVLAISAGWFVLIVAIPFVFIGYLYYWLFFKDKKRD